MSVWVSDELPHTKYQTRWKKIFHRKYINACSIWFDIYRLNCYCPLRLTLLPMSFKIFANHIPGKNKNIHDCWLYVSRFDDFSHKKCWNRSGARERDDVTHIFTFTSQLSRLTIKSQLDHFSHYILIWESKSIHVYMLYVASCHESLCKYQIKVDRIQLGFWKFALIIILVHSVPFLLVLPLNNSCNIIPLCHIHSNIIAKLFECK